MTHQGTNPDPSVIKTLMNGGAVEEKYVTWDREELDWTARANVEAAVQDGLLRKSLGDSEFEKLSAEERRDLRDQVHLFEREIENLGGVVDDDRLAKLFNNAIIQGNKDRVLKSLVYEQDPEGFDKVLEQKGMTLNDIQNPHELKGLQTLAAPTDQGGGFSFFKKLKEQGGSDDASISAIKKAWEPRSYVLLRNETPEFLERKKSLKNALQEQIAKVKIQISELKNERGNSIKSRTTSP